MNAAITDVRDALAEVCKTIPGLRASKTVEAQVNPPQAIVVPGGMREDGRVVIQYDSTMANGSHTYTFTIKLVIGTAVDRVAQEKLDGYVSPDGEQSIRAAIDADPTLGGLVSYARAHSVVHYGMLTWNNLQYVGADLLVEVVT